jgi:DNA-binding response OmpR family regulator
MARILIVDDEPDIVMIAKITLEELGHETHVAGNGEECLKKLKEEKFDLILLDVMMPDDSGWEVCRKIKADEKTKDIPVVMFTVRTSNESVAKGRECGGDAQIDKPFRIDDLIGTVEKVLKGS